MPSFRQRNDKPILETNDLKNWGWVLKPNIGPESVVTLPGDEFVTTMTSTLTNGAARRKQRRIRRELQGNILTIKLYDDSIEKALQICKWK